MRRPLRMMLAAAVYTCLPAVAAAAPPDAAPDENEAKDKKPDEKDKKPDADEVKDAVRVRGGFGLGGGVIVTTDSGVLGPVVALQGRIGVQFNHYFGLIYANTPHLVLTVDSGVTAGFVDWNTIMATLTLGHFFEVGGGPSFDYYAIASCSSGGCGTGTGFGFGVHERLAFLIGGLSGKGPRRSGFQIGVDAHQAFITDGTIPITLTAQLGADWY